VPATSAVLLFQMSELMLTCAFRENGSAREGASSLRRLTSSSLASSSSSSSITTATTFAQRSKICYSFLQNNFSSRVQSRNLSALKNRYTRNEGRAIGTIGSERYFSHSNTNMRRRARDFHSCAPACGKRQSGSNTTSTNKDDRSNSRNKGEPSRVGLRVNKDITSKFVRLVSDTGKEDEDSKDKSTTHEILSIEKALLKASKANLDLVEVSPNASPPVCRLIDYETYRFEQKRREKEQKKKLNLRKKSDVVRELRITSRIDDHDLSKKTENANKFLLEGHKVLFRINFKNAHDEIGLDKRLMKGKDVMKRVEGWLQDYELEKEPGMVGPNSCTMMIRPIKKRCSSRRHLAFLKQKKED
jgi:translation initiation factor IF-3